MSYLRLQWDRVGAWVAVALGLLALLLGYIGVSGTDYPAEQIPYIVSGGLLGLFLLGLAGILYLSADLRDEWRKLDDLEQVVRVSLERSAVQEPCAPAIRADDGARVAAPPARKARTTAAEKVR